MNMQINPYIYSITLMISEELRDWWNDLTITERELIILEAYTTKKLNDEVRDEH